ncbi:MAG: hypothetical protein N2482_03490 [Patescibacteria group bacterium]|nr:hypothetical protein [Patescibacteria group bacterium]
MRNCPYCKGTVWYHLSSDQKRCKTCGLTRYFKSKTFYNQTRINQYWKGKLVEYFALGLPVYRIRFRVPYSRKTIERFFKIIREPIYINTVQKKENKLSGIFEIDETMFSGKRKGKRCWGAKGKHIVFGVYKRNGEVLTHIIKSRDGSVIIPLVCQTTVSVVFIILMIGTLMPFYL